MAQFIKELPIGSIVVDSDSPYLGEPIKWMIIDKDYNKQSNTITLQTLDLISPKAFSAVENQGVKYNSNYENSDVRQWLNADSVDWYEQKSLTDEAPSTSLLEGCVGYDVEPGFLHNLSEKLSESLQEMEYLLETNGNVISLKDKVLIPSTSQLFDGENREGIRYRHYSEASHLIKDVSDECYELNKIHSTDPAFASGQPYLQMLRTRLNESEIYSVAPKGTEVKGVKANSLSCVAPIITIDADTVVSSAFTLDHKDRPVYTLYLNDENSVDKSLNQRIRLKQVEGGANHSTLEERLANIEGWAERGLNYVDTDTISIDLDMETNTFKANIKTSLDGDNKLEALDDGLFVKGATTIEHTQANKAFSWAIHHGLQCRFPTINVVDEDGNNVIGNIEYSTINMLTIQFEVPTKGKAYVTAG